MPATSYGPFASMGSRNRFGFMVALLALIAQTVTLTSAKSISTEQALAAAELPLSLPSSSSSSSSSSSLSSSSSTAAVESPMFSLPTRIDDDDVLEEYGKFMVSAMNQSVDPCEDFYEYACGNWKHAETVPIKLRNDSFLHSIQTAIDNMLVVYLKNATEEELKSTKASSKAKMFFNSCTKMNKEMDRGYKQIWESTDFTKKLEKSSENETLDWITINFMSDYGVYPLLPLKVHYETETRKFDLALSPPTRILSNSILIDIKNITRDLKITDESLQKTFTEQFEKMVGFEKNLTAHVSRRNESETLRLDDFLLEHYSDNFNWTRYFHVAFNGSAKSVWTVHNTIENVDSLVKFLNKTDLETLRNYVKWRTLIKFYYNWKSETNDKLVENICRSHTEQYFNYALIPWFIEKVYDADRRADVLHVAKHIKETFYDLIDKYTWLDDETKSNAKTKLSAMDIEVGYSDDMRHEDLIDQVYTDVNMTDDWFKNVFTMEANRAKVRMRSVNKAIIPPLMTTRNANAYYADFLNLVFIAIGITQLPFYHMKFPPSMKFGGVGNIIGHEMAHGFDSYCYQYNYDGKKQNWWTEASLRNFKERYRCLESQYNKYIYRGVPTNGTLTSGDNIADNVGARVAYYAYMNSHGKVDGERKPIPKLNFTNKQLYFLKFAQTWCTGKDDAYKVRKIKTDVHAYEEFRVSGTLVNMPEFSEVFKCKLGSDMNPLKKCVVW